MAQMRWERDNLELYEKQLAENNCMASAKSKLSSKEKMNANNCYDISNEEMQELQQKSLCATYTTCSANMCSLVDHEQMQRVQQTHRKLNAINQINETTINDDTQPIDPADDKQLDQQDVEIDQNNNQILSFNHIVQNQQQENQKQKRHRRMKSTSIPINQQPLLLLSLLILVCAFFTLETSLFCVCDNQQQQQQQLINDTIATIANLQAKNQLEHHLVNSNSITHQHQSKSRYKDKLITYLSDEIEKKHFNLIAGKLRPSKFDNGQDIDFIQLDNSNNVYNSKLDGKSKLQAASQTSATFAQPDTTSTAVVAAAAMNDIMKLHELAEQQRAPKLQQLSTSPSKRSRAINPVKLVANMVMKSTENLQESSSSAQNPSSPIAHKIVSNLVNNYITPYIVGLSSQAKFFQYSEPSTTDMIGQESTSENNVQIDSNKNQNRLHNNPILSSIVAGRGSKSGFKFLENPLKLLLSQASPSSTTTTSNYLFQHKPSNYHKPTTSTTLSPISSIQFSDLKDPLDLAESTSSLLSPAANSLSDQLAIATTNGNNQEINTNSNKDTTFALLNGQDDGKLSGSGSGDGKTRQQANKWFKNSMMSQLVQGSLRDILALTQLPIGGGGGSGSGVAMLASATHNHHQNPFTSLLSLGARPLQSTKKLSTAPSVLESNSKHKLSTNEMALGSRFIEELLRFAYILSSGVRTKRDPYLALLETPKPSSATTTTSTTMANDLNTSSSFNQRSTPVNHHQGSSGNSATSDKQSLISAPSDSSSSSGGLIGKQIAQKIKTILLNSATTGLSNNKARPRGIMWEMATDPSLAVTVFHLLERASVAVPLGFLLLPFVKMIRSPLAGLDFGRLLPPRASHRSVELEELAKRLDLVDKMLSRALRPTHREATFMAG